MDDIAFCAPCAKWHACRKKPSRRCLTPYLSVTGRASASIFAAIPVLKSPDICSQLQVLQTAVYSALHAGLVVSQSLCDFLGLSRVDTSAVSHSSAIYCDALPHPDREQISPECFTIGAISSDT